MSRWTSLLLKFVAAGFILLINPAFSAELQLIGGVIILQIVVVGTALPRLVRVPAGRDATRPADYESDADDPWLDRLDYLLDGMPEKSGAHALR